MWNGEGIGQEKWGGGLMDRGELNEPFQKNWHPYSPYPFSPPQRNPTWKSISRVRSPLLNLVRSLSIDILFHPLYKMQSIQFLKHRFEIEFANRQREHDAKF